MNPLRVRMLALAQLALAAAAIHGAPAKAQFHAALHDLPLPEPPYLVDDGDDPNWPGSPHSHPPFFTWAADHGPTPTTAPAAAARPAAPAATVRQLYTAFAQGDLPRLLGALAPDVRWVEAEGGPYGGVYVGPQAVREGVFKRIGAEWRGYQAEPQQVVADGQTVIVRGRYRGTCDATGKPISTPFVHIWTVSGGLVQAFEQYTDTAMWWRAMGR